jgi:hypothetical protein
VRFALGMLASLRLGLPERKALLQPKQEIPVLSSAIICNRANDKNIGSTGRSDQSSRGLRKLSRRALRHLRQLSAGITASPSRKARNITAHATNASEAIPAHC